MGRRSGSIEAAFGIVNRVQAGEIGGVGGDWIIDSRGYDIYKVGAGDTYSSLANAYLNDPNRWFEIYAIQSDNWRNNTKRGSTNLAIGDELYMPQEAVDAAGGGANGAGAVPRTPYAYADPAPQPNPIPAGSSAPVQPSQPSTPSKPSTPSTPSTPVQPSSSNWKKWALYGGIGLGAVTLLGGAAWALTSD